MRITADIIDDEGGITYGTGDQAAASQLSDEIIEGFEADLKNYTARLNMNSNHAKSPASEFHKMQNDIFREMCKKFSNLNISTSEHGLSGVYPSFEGIAATEPEKKIFVSNLPPACYFGLLNKYLLSDYGKAIECHFIRDNAAILTMETREQAEEAIKHLNGCDFYGHKIGVMKVHPEARTLSHQLYQELCKPKLEEFLRSRKMSEAKASSSSKEKSDVETPSPWMMQFLLKMKQEIKEEILEELINVPRIEMQGNCTANGKGDENQSQGEVVHPNIYCDNCDQLIHGIRYKCGNCTDFDLCQECESLPNIHDKNHVFLKIRNPVSLTMFMKQKWTPLILPPASDFIIPSSKCHSSKKLYEAKFVCDETVPDGTVLAPSTQFVKSWRVLNSGKRVWTHSTKLQHIQGSIGLNPASELVDVPHLRPGEEGIVSVLFTTPAIPGVYRSHWNFCHRSRPFGHIVWCHIVVKEPASEDKQVDAAAQALNLSTKKILPSEKEKEVASIAKVLTAVKEEHEKGNMIPRKLAVNSHTATPNNTPFDLTPPKSPDHQVVNELKVVMEDKESVSSLNIEDYDHEEDDSVVSLSSSESDAEFVVIPMPNCFNLSESFASHSHLSQYLQSENVGDQISRPCPKSSKLQNILLKQPTLNTETVSQETGVPELSERSTSLSEEGKEREQKIIFSHNVSGNSSSSEISIIESGENSPTALNPSPGLDTIVIAVTDDAESKKGEEVVIERKNSVQQETADKDEQTTDIPCSSATFPKFPVEGITSIYEPASSNSEMSTVQVLPESIVTVPLSVASTVYNATMQCVMKNLRRHTPTTEGATGTARSSLQPMEQLTEMGFCNRQQNEELLRKHKNNVHLVVAELVSLNDNEWYASRHVPPSAPSFD